MSLEAEKILQLQAQWVAEVLRHAACRGLGMGDVAEACIDIAAWTAVMDGKTFEELVAMMRRSWDVQVVAATHLPTNPGDA